MTVAEGHPAPSGQRKVAYREKYETGERIKKRGEDEESGRGREGEHLRSYFKIPESKISSYVSPQS